MAKRFSDTEKYKKPFIRSLKGPYKLLWDYICLNCNYAGIWQVDFQIAQVYIGTDMPVNEKDALQAFNADCERIVTLDGGKKWFIRPFIVFQYGELNAENRVHASVISVLGQAGIKGLASPVLGASAGHASPMLGPGKDLVSPLEGSGTDLTSPALGAKDKEKDKEKDMAKDKETAVNCSLKSLTTTTIDHRIANYEQKANDNTFSSSATAADALPPVSGQPLTNQQAVKNAYTQDFETFWQAYPRKVGKGAAYARWRAKKPDINSVLSALNVQKQCEQWEDITLIPHPATWLSQERWEDDPSAYSKRHKPSGDDYAYTEAEAMSRAKEHDYEP